MLDSFRFFSFVSIILLSLVQSSFQKNELASYCEPMNANFIKKQTQDLLTSIEKFDYDLFLKLYPKDHLFQPGSFDKQNRSEFYGLTVRFDLYREIVSKNMSLLNNEHILSYNISKTSKDWATNTYFSHCRFFAGASIQGSEKYTMKHNSLHDPLSSMRDVKALSVEPKNLKKNKNILIYKTKTIVAENGSNKPEIFMNPSANVVVKRHYRHRRRYISKKVIYVGVLADCHYVRRLGGRKRAIKKIFNEWNLVSEIYEANLGLKIALSKLHILENCYKHEYHFNDRCSSNLNLTDKLRRFSDSLHSNNTNVDIWHLMTDCFVDGVKGLAYVNGINRAKQSKNTGASTLSTSQWTTIAHELGHNLGAIHDCSELKDSDHECNPCEEKWTCNEDYIMSHVSMRESKDFSPGSKYYILKNIQNLQPEKHDKPAIIREDVCGNGIVEDTEQCDCGTLEECEASECCTSSCKFKAGAECDDKNDLCCQKGCKLKPKGSVCRISTGECDLEETCDGLRGSCPDDVFIEDGKPCSEDKNDGLKCASGYCTSMDLQCQMSSSNGKIKEARKSRNKFTNTCQIECVDRSDSYVNYHKFNYIKGTECGKHLYCNEDLCEGAFWDKLCDLIVRNMAIFITTMMLILIILSLVVWLIIRKRSRIRGFFFPCIKNK